VVRLDLPPHWRTLYWAFAAWSVGACVEVPAHRTSPDAGHDPVPSAAAPVAPDVVVTDAVDAAAAAPEAVLVTLAALARSAGGPVPPGVVDEARELATHGDVFDGWAEPDDGDPALRADGVLLSYADLPTGSTGSTGGPQRVHTGTTDTAELLRLALSVWAADGSLVLSRGEPDPAVLEARLAAEGVSAASAPRPPSR